MYIYISLCIHAYNIHVLLCCRDNCRNKLLPSSILSVINDERDFNLNAFTLQRSLTHLLSPIPEKLE